MHPGLGYEGKECNQQYVILFSLLVPMALDSGCRATTSEWGATDAKCQAACGRLAAGVWPCPWDGNGGQWLLETKCRPSRCRPMKTLVPTIRFSNLGWRINDSWFSNSNLHWAGGFNCCGRVHLVILLVVTLHTERVDHCMSCRCFHHDNQIVSSLSEDAKNSPGNETLCVIENRTHFRITSGYLAHSAGKSSLLKTVNHHKSSYSLCAIIFNGYDW